MEVAGSLKIPICMASLPRHSDLHKTFYDVKKSAVTLVCQVLRHIGVTETGECGRVKG
jgi:hypothetical protein